jgi:hypothetical protein
MHLACHANELLFLRYPRICIVRLYLLQREHRSDEDFQNHHKETSIASSYSQQLRHQFLKTIYCIHQILLLLEKCSQFPALVRVHSNRLFHRVPIFLHKINFFAYSNARLLSSIAPYIYPPHFKNKLSISTHFL